MPDSPTAGREGGRRDGLPYGVTPSFREGMAFLQNVTRSARLHLRAAKARDYRQRHSVDPAG